MKNDQQSRLYYLKVSALILIILTCLSSSACTRYYYNPEYPNDMQQQILSRDVAYCKTLASGAIPTQQLIVNSVPNESSSGDFQAYSSGEKYSGTFNSHTEYDNSATQMADMANAMTLIASSTTRDNIYTQCLIGKGWRQIEDKILTEEERKQFGLLPDGEIQFYYNRNYPEGLQQLNFNQDSSLCRNPEQVLTYRQCMIKKGWHKTKGKKLSSEERAFFGLGTQKK